MLPATAACAAILITAPLAFTPAWARAQTLAITGVTLIDGTGKAPLRDGVVVISDARISAVGRSREVAIPNGARRLDARGKYVIPGLMDANLHLCCAGGLETLIKYEDRYHEIALEAAQITLKTGQTTVFDTWGPRAALVKARDMINAGEAPGSRIYLAGNIIGFDGPFSADFLAQPGALGRAALHVVSEASVKRFNEIWEQGTGRRLLRMTPEEVRSTIREYAQKEVDFLKYGASDHGYGGNFITFSPRVQRVIVEEAHRAGMSVQAHTTSTESLDLAIEAGVDIVTHGDLTLPPSTIPQETIRKLVERRIFVSVLPVTQRRLEALERLGVRDLGVPEWPVGYFKVAKANRRNMLKAGVTMLLMTDASIQNPVLLAESPTLAADTVDPTFQLGESHFNALVALEEEGMDPMEILKSVTSHIARAYKVDAEIGTLEAGKIADLVILDANPLESARNYRRIHSVIKDGRVVDLDTLPVAPIVTVR